MASLTSLISACLTSESPENILMLLAPSSWLFSKCLSYSSDNSFSGFLQNTAETPGKPQLKRPSYYFGTEHPQSPATCQKTPCASFVGGREERVEGTLPSRGEVRELQGHSEGSGLVWGREETDRTAEAKKVVPTPQTYHTQYSLVTGGDGDAFPPTSIWISLGS